ncbi:cupredoxin domain-containing protein [Natrialbaceae archaeon A-gly3]
MTRNPEHKARARETHTITDLPRRTVLKIASATGVVAGIGSLGAMADDHDEDDEDDEEAEEVEDEEDEDEEVEDEPIPIVLGGKTDHWLGLVPEPIETEENPTLSVQADRDYEVVWINMDGEPHEFAILDEDGDELEVAGEEVEEIGEVQRFEFTATEELAGYHCTVHPETMVGDVELEEVEDDEDDDDEDDDFGFDDEDDR